MCRLGLLFKALSTMGTNSATKRRYLLASIFQANGARPPAARVMGGINPLIRVSFWTPWRVRVCVFMLVVNGSAGALWRLYGLILGFSSAH